MQWHPVFAQLLRPLLANHYDVRTNVPVGDLPRAADIVVVSRTSRGAPPFTGLWSRLTAWNVLEFKGPTVSARVRDRDLLVELGLGIARRLASEGKRRAPARGQTTLWYLARHIGGRFLRDARALLRGLDEVAPGVWRGEVVGHPVLLVSSRAVAVERDTLPMHVLIPEPLEAGRVVLEQLASQADLWALYSAWLATNYPDLWEEVRYMAKRTKKPDLDMRPVVEKMGLAKLIEQIGLDRVVATAGAERVLGKVNLGKLVEEKGLDWLLARLTPEQRRELRRRSE